MLTLQTRLRPNVAEVAAKVMDGEAIMINLSNGIYYSMDQVGGLIWEMIEGNHSLEEMVAAVLARYDVSPEHAQADVERLIGELVEEHLVVVSHDAAPTDESPMPEPSPRLPYASPTLNIYRDMGDLLALDPPLPGLEDTPWREPIGG